MDRYGDIWCSGGRCPLGLFLHDAFRFIALGIATLTLPLFAILFNFWVKPTIPHVGERIPLRRIIRLIWRRGLALALQGAGFAVIGTFISLFFEKQGWAYAGLALSCFGIAYIIARIFFGHLPDKLGGLKVASYSLLLEAIGLIVLWQATSPQMALVGAALTGLGCSLVFPSLGVEVLKRVPLQVRGTATGGYAAFQDRIN